VDAVATIAAGPARNLAREAGIRVVTRDGGTGTILRFVGDRAIEVLFDDDDTGMVNTDDAMLQGTWDPTDDVVDINVGDTVMDSNGVTLPGPVQLVTQQGMVVVLAGKSTAVVYHRFLERVEEPA
jgi:hypothetical protein